MGFVRWGMDSACPTFQEFEKYEGPVTERGGKGMTRADKLAKSYPGKEHHVGFDDYIDHPDALAFEKSWEDIDALIAEVKLLRKERDAAIADLQVHPDCACCEKWDSCYPRLNKQRWHLEGGACWQWRGVQVKEGQHA